MTKCIYRDHEHYKRLHSIWSTMKSRCNNPNRKKYSRYGAIGIKVCKEWSDSFEIFFEWSLSHGYEPDLTIDRIDNDGDYEPSNCRWVTNQVNSLNRSTSILLTVNEETLNASVWSEKLNISRYTIYDWCRVHGVSYAESRIESMLGGVV